MAAMMDAFNNLSDEERSQTAKAARKAAFNHRSHRANLAN
jgi:hypothetical protein